MDWPEGSGAEVEAGRASSAMSALKRAAEGDGLLISSQIVERPVSQASFIYLEPKTGT